MELVPADDPLAVLTSRSCFPPSTRRRPLQVFVEPERIPWLDLGTPKWRDGSGEKRRFVAELLNFGARTETDYREKALARLIASVATERIAEVDRL